MKGNKTYIIGIILVITFLSINLFSKYQQKTKIKNYKKKTIAYTKDIYYTEHSEILKFYFYANGKLFMTEKSFKDLPKKSILNKYYLVKYDENNPTNNFISIDKEIYPDSTSLVKAGFKYVTYFEHDISTNSYVKKHKWQ